MGGILGEYPTLHHGSNPRMNAAAYLRKSSDQDDSELKSVERQRRDAVVFAKEKGWHVIDQHILVDEGISGAEANKRPGYRALKELISANKVERLIIADLSRVARDQVEQQSFLKLATEHRVEVWEVSTGRAVQFTTAQDKLVASISGFQHEAFREFIRGKTKGALADRFRLGYSTGHRVYGFTSVEEGAGHRRVIDEVQAAAVRRAFDLCAQGNGDLKIARILQAEDHPAPRPPQPKK